MANVSHILFIDESGNAQTGRSVLSLWVSAGMAVPFERARDLDAQMNAFRSRNFRSRIREVKGSYLPHELRHGRSLTDVAQDLSRLLSEFDTHNWVVAVRRPDFEDGPYTKNMARQLLLERVNGFLNIGNYEPEHWLVVWDISDVQELTDFSASVARFRNAFTGDHRNERLIPLVLGGLSHDWGALQAVDLLSNFALHYRGAQKGFPDVSREKAQGFGTFLKEKLQKTSSGDIIGWKTWG